MQKRRVMSILKINFQNEITNGDEYDFTIKECAVEHCHPRKAPEVGTRDYYALHIVVFGSGFCERDGVKYKISKGDFFLTYKDEPFNYYPNVKDPWSYYYIDFYADNIEGVFKAMGCTKENFYGNIKSLNKVSSICQELVESFDVSTGQSLHCIGMFLVLLSLLMNDYRDGFKSAEKSKQQKAKQFQAILMYINNNYRLDLKMSDIASSVGLSESYITAIFAEEIQMAPMRYLNNYRIAVACGLLKDSNMSISDIAIAVGFKDRLYFSRLFSKIKGVSPKRYKLEMANDDPFSFIKDKNIKFRYGF